MLTKGVAYALMSPWLHIECMLHVFKLYTTASVLSIHILYTCVYLTNAFLLFQICLQKIKAAHTINIV